MAIDLQEIVKINASEGLKTLKELREAITEYRGALANLAPQISEYKDTLAELEEKEREYQDILNSTTEGTEEYASAQSSLEDATQQYEAVQAQLNETQEEYLAIAQATADAQAQIRDVMSGTASSAVAQKGSMNELLNTLRQQKAEWKALGDAQDEERQKLTEQINETKAKINELNESIGNHQHNVGNYTDSIMGAFSKMGISFGSSGKNMTSALSALSGGMEGAETAMKGLWTTMLANPIGVVVAAVGVLIGAFAGLSDAVNTSEENQDRMHTAMANFRPLSDAFSQWMDNVGSAFTDLISWLGETYSQLRMVYAAWSDWIGISEGSFDKVKGEVSYYQTLAEAENQIIDYTRAVNEKNANDKISVERLRDEAAATKDATEKAEKLSAAKKAQTKINERNTALAKAELAILEAEAKVTPNNREMNDRLSEARVKVLETEAQGYRSLRMLDRGITSATASTAKHTKALDNEAKALERLRKEAEKTYEKIIEGEMDERQVLEKNYMDDAALLKEALDKKAISQEKYDKAITILAEQYAQQRKDILYKEIDEALKIEEEKRRKQIEAAEDEHDRKLAELEFDREIAEREKEIKGSSEDGQVFDLEARFEEYDADLEAYKNYIEAKIALNDALMESYEFDSQERRELEMENALLLQDLAAKQAEIDKKKTEDYKKLMKARETAAKNMATGTAAVLKNVASAMGENTKLAKGFGIAAATIDTIAAAVAGFRAGYNQWKDIEPMAWMAPIQAALNATAALAAGFAQVQKIRSVDVSGSDSGGGMATALAIPNIEGLTSPVDYTRQVTTQTEQEQMNQESRVYILESDIQTSNRRVRVREEETTF